jgi:hypothetical protein
MSETKFEYEERYKETNPLKTQRKLAVAKFALSHIETQIDHWFIPKDIMSPNEQGQWFDYDQGYALRIREETSGAKPRVIITSKRLLRPADHSAMTNNEEVLTAGGMLRILTPMESEFISAIATLRRMGDEAEMSYGEAKRLIEDSGRKEYITLEKTRSVYRSDAITDIEVDMDTIPALQATALGFWASVEIEYTGAGTLDEAREKVRALSHELGYRQEDILKKALPGLAIPYLATF